MAHTPARTPAQSPATGVPVRIANFSGYLGDRYQAFDEVMAGEQVDVLIGDYLAEITLAALAGRYRAGSGGYVGYFLDQLGPHLPEIARRGLKVVANAGGFDPAGLAAAVRAAASDAGAEIEVAHVEGDTIIGELPALSAEGHRLRHLDTGAPLSSWGVEPITANAYLGGWGIAEALARGADIVVCGRVTDASLVAGPAAWWHGWSRTDWNELAGAVVAGHVIECGAHATGGNFSGFRTVPKLVKPGFPFAEIAADGSSVITKHGQDDGAVTVDTVTAQLVYEIQGPRYLNPDVTAHIESVRLEQAAADRVLVYGTTGSPPPPTTKVAVFGRIGYQVVTTAFVTAPDVAGKVDLLRTQLAAMIPADVEWTLTPLGAEHQDPGDQWEATVPVRVIAMAGDRDTLTSLNLPGRIGSLFLQSIPGFFTDTAAQPRIDPRQRIEYWPALLAQDALRHRVVLSGGDAVIVDPPPVTGEPERITHPEPGSLPDLGATRQAPIGRVCYARSGDKGGNCNVGVWVPEALRGGDGGDGGVGGQAWDWLRHALSTERLRRLLPEVAELDIDRHEFPHLRAVHFVLRGLLGTGGSANLRVDAAGKAVGEYLRAKHIEIPATLLDSA